MNATYIQGEVATFSIADAGFTTATLRYGSSEVSLSHVGSVWSANIDTSALSGLFNYAAFADGTCVEHGAFYVIPLVSKYRAVVDAIDEALQSVATNGKYTVNVGELSLTDKTFDEMVKFRRYYERMAVADEGGETPSFGPARKSEIYA